MDGLMYIFCISPLLVVEGVALLPNSVELERTAGVAYVEGTHRTISNAVVAKEREREKEKLGENTQQERVFGTPLGILKLLMI